LLGVDGENEGDPCKATLDLSCEISGTDVENVGAKIAVGEESIKFCGVAGSGRRCRRQVGWNWSAIPERVNDNETAGVVN
jgi:hypothetical protein